MASQGPTLAIAANFATDAFEPPLRRWFDRVGMAPQIAWMPLDQVFQALRDPVGIFGVHTEGVHLLLVQWRRWTSEEEARALDRGETAPPERLSSWTLFESALRECASRSRIPLWILFCPSSEPVPSEGAFSAWDQLETEIQKALRGLEGVECWTSAQWLAESPAGVVLDPYADRLGMTPLTGKGWDALALAVARRYARRMSPPFKVVIVDADDTLWDGVCGEVGTLGVKVGEARLALQHRLLEARDRGVLLCLCSQNEETDALQVLDQHPGMLLRRSHFAAWKINWESKADNLGSLAAELGLGMDSFLFIDDDPLQRAIVRERCPGVTVLDLPRPSESLHSWLEGQWLLDFRFGPSSVIGGNRTSQYQAEHERRPSLTAAQDLRSLVADLQLQVECRTWEARDLSRVAELIQRTNQFNATVRRHRESELREGFASGRWEGIVVEARDRFGDYGLIGVLLFHIERQTLEVDTLLMSCRALGRGIEANLLAHAGETARQRGVTACLIPFVPAPRNRPAKSFLDRIPDAIRKETAQNVQYAWNPASWIVLPELAARAPLSELSAAERAAPAQAATAEKAIPRCWPSEIVANALALERVALASSSSSHAAPSRTPGKADNAASPLGRLCDIWAEVLELNAVSPQDNFFELSGASLSMIRVLSRIREEFGVEIPIRAFFEDPTPSALHAWMMGQASGGNPGIASHAPVEAVSPGVPAPRAREANPAPDAVPNAARMQCVTIPTRGSPALVECLHSLFGNLARHGRHVEAVVADDSPDPAVQERTRVRIQEAAAKFGVRTTHLGQREKAAFLARLARLGIPEDLLAFALSDAEQLGNATGANRNWLLLATAGRLFFSMDDDAAAYPSSLGEGSKELRFAESEVEEELIYFTSREEALAFGNREDFDILGAHEGAMQWKLEACENLRPGEAARLGNGPVLLTFNGLSGDCGWGAPFGFWGEPVGCLTLEGESRKRMVRDEAAYRLACTSRDIFRAVAQPTLTPHPRCLTGFMAADHRHLLPPFVPAGRGQDLFFGKLVEKMHHGALAAYLPWTLVHAPDRKRRFSPGELFRSAEGSDLAKLFLDILSSIEISGEVGDPAARMAAIGKGFVSAAGKGAGDFQARACELAGRSAARQRERLQASLDAHNSLPEDWAKDVRAFHSAIGRGLRSEHLGLPLELLLIKGSPEAAWQSARRLVENFGRLLEAWDAFRTAGLPRT